jgi:hypothetical protein
MTYVKDAKQFMALPKNISVFNLVLSLFFLLAPLTAQTQTLTSLGFSADQQTILCAGEPLQNTAKSANDIALLPQGTLKQNLLTTINIRPSKDIIELVTLLPTPRQSSPLVLLTGLLNTPSLSGLKYYSRREKATITLIYEAFVITSPSDRTRIDPPQPRTLPETLEMYIWQDDETFGEKVYRVTATTHAPTGEILMFSTNVDKLSQGPITMAHPSEMRSFGWFIPTPDGLLVYQTIANAQAIPGFVRKNAHESMFNRLKAVINWVKEMFPQ